MVCCHQNFKVMVSVALILVWGCMVAFPGMAKAEDVKTLMKEINSGLRSAQKDMFGGKTDQAIAALPAISDKIGKVKAAQPDNSGLKSLESKFQKLVKDLERRTGKDLGGGTVTAAGSSSETALPEKPAVKALDKALNTPAQQPAATQSEPEPAAAKGAESAKPAKLPYHARKPLKDAMSNLKRMEMYLQKLKDPKYPGDKGQVIQNMDASLEQARELIQQSKEAAAEKGVSEHPEIQGAQMLLAKALQDAKAAGVEYEEAKSRSDALSWEMEKDVFDLRALSDEMTPYFNKAPGTVTYYNDVKELEPVIAAIEEFESGHMQNVGAALEKFKAKYGGTKDEIDQKVKELGYSGVCCAGSFYATLASGVENIQKSRTAMAADIIAKADEMKTVTQTRAHDFSRTKNRERIQDWVAMAKRFSPDHPAVASFEKSLKDWIAKDGAALEAKIDSAKWPGKHAADAPSNAKKLAKEAMAWCEKENSRLAAKDKISRKMLGVVVTGPWRVFKYNILNNPVQYALPVITAVQLESEKEANRARVYILSLLTAEGENIKPEPPFTGATVGDSYYIRPSAVK